MLWEYGNQIIFGHKMSQNMDSGTGSQLSKYNSRPTCWRWKIITSATSDASDTMNFWNNWVNIYDKLYLIAQDILAAPASQAYVEMGFSVCGLLTVGRRNRMKQNDQVIANASLFETEQKSIGEHRHQCLCVVWNFTLIGMNCTVQISSTGQPRFRLRNFLTQLCSLKH